MTTYTPEWARDDSPTKGLSTEAMLKYYKDHSVAGWCRFYLENPGETSPELLAAIQALYDACVVKQKPAHKLQRELLARRWQTEAAARLSVTTETKPCTVNVGPTAEQALESLRAGELSRRDAQERLAEQGRLAVAA